MSPLTFPRHLRALITPFIAALGLVLVSPSTGYAAPAEQHGQKTSTTAKTGKAKKATKKHAKKTASKRSKAKRHGKATAKRAATPSRHQGKSPAKKH